MIQCKRCHKQYLGETKRLLKDHFNEHRRPVDKPTNISKPTTVSEHFLIDHHTLPLMTSLELIHYHSNDVSEARVAYLMARGNILQSLGLNAGKKRDVQ